MPATVTVAAAYTKNGQPATLPLPPDLAADLAAYVAAVDPGSAPSSPCRSRRERGCSGGTWPAAGIAYRDESGLVFDFHSLRCQCATLADQAGVTPRVVQKLMRHSSLELTGRYTRPRAVDIDHASSMLPSLKPEPNEPEAKAMTGTDSAPMAHDFTPRYPRRYPRDRLWI